MTTHAYETDLMAAFNTDSRGIARMIKRRGFPPALDLTKGGEAYWDKGSVRDWLEQNPTMLDRASMRLDWWPAATTAAEYLGAEPYYGPYSTAHTATAVTQRWRLATGEVVVMVWPLLGHAISVHLDHIRANIPTADAYAKLLPGWGLWGPELVAATAKLGDGGSDIEFDDLARVLGQPVPFWPSRTRTVALIEAWQPGDAPVQQHGISDIDVTPLLHMAALYPCSHPVHAAMMHTAQVINADHDATLGLDHELYRERIKPGERVTPEHLTLAVDPIASPKVDVDDLDTATLRAGWLEVLDRVDPLAKQCVQVSRSWDGGKSLPYPQVMRVNPTEDGTFTPAAAEFLARLEPVTQQTALYGVLTTGDPDETALVDPVDGVPVMRAGDSYLTLAAPRQLPTTSPLAELVLDHPIWVRTADGTLHVAPYDSYFGLSWGYRGSGPLALATLAEALLDDPTAPGACLGVPVNEGLLTLFAGHWPKGTVFTRGQLEAARAGFPDKPDTPSTDN